MVSNSSLIGVRLPLAPQIASLTTTMLAQESVSPRELGEQPTSGGARPGPVNAVPGLRAPGIMPVELTIKAIELDATIEQQQIENGVMQNPSGPFVVAWYKETGRLGEEQNNVVLAGHLDYWDVGPAIFYDIWKLESGNKLHITGKNGSVFVYKVERSPTTKPPISIPPPSRKSSDPPKTKASPSSPAAAPSITTAANTNPASSSAATASPASRSSLASPWITPFGSVASPFMATVDRNYSAFHKPVCRLCSQHSSWQLGAGPP